MKTFGSIITFLFLTGIVNAQQLINPNFEQWSFVDTTWDGQSIYNADNWTGATRTEDSYAGNFAAKAVPQLSCGIMPGLMMYGALNQQVFNQWVPEPNLTGSGYPYTANPISLKGFFKFPSPDTNDQASGKVILRKFNQVSQLSEEIGRGEIVFSPTDSYTPFTIDITYSQPNVQPDSIVIFFISGTGFAWDNQNNIEIMGSIYLDQLRMEYAGTADIQETSDVQCTFFPNPTSEVLQFSFTTNEHDDFSILLYDASGKIVAKQKTEAGTTQSLSVSALSAGTYRAVLMGKSGKLYVERSFIKN